MKKIRKIMEMRGINQSELAERAGLTTGGISLILNDKRMPKWDTMCALADALGVSVAELRDEEEDERPDDEAEKCAHSDRICA